MNNFPNRQTVERVRSQYPQGTRVELVSMSDAYTSLKSGDRGTVDLVDDTATVFVRWDSGSSLGAVYGGDIIRKLTRAEVIKEQCEAVARTGRTNMFGAKAAFEIALEMDFGELADFIFMDTERYANLILTGELEDTDLIEWP